MTDRRKQALIEMAKRGTAEERKIAEEIIERSGISIEDETIENFEFKYRTALEKRLLLQVWVMITDKRTAEYWTNKNKKSTLIFELTKLEAMELKMFYSIYKRELKKEMDFTLEAFIQQNNIFAPSGEAVESDKSIEEQSKMAMRMSSIDKTQIRKQLSS